MQLEFEACYHEHKDTFTWRPLRRVLHGCYYWTKIISYNILALVLGLKLAFIAGLLSALTSFLYTWVWGPILKNFIFWVYAIAPVVSVPIQALYTPLVDASGRIFRQFRINASLNGKSLEKLSHIAWRLVLNKLLYCQHLAYYWTIWLLLLLFV